MLVVFGEPSPCDALRADGGTPPLCERQLCHSIVKIVVGPDGRGLAGRRREIGQVDEPVLRKVRIEHHIVQTLSSDDLHIRDAGDGCGIDAVAIGDPQNTRPLCNQKAAVRQECKRPGTAQAAHENLDMHGR
jgi:hypothetical protein